MIIPWDGKKISKPGAYSGVPMDVYHDNLCVGASISSTGIRQLDPAHGQSPLHFWWNSYMNPDREDEERPHFSFGRAVHTLLLGEDGFSKQFAVRPAEFKDYRTAAAKQWRDDAIKAGLGVLLPSDLDAIRGIAKNIERDELVQQGLLQGHIETTLAAPDRETGVWLKARPDIFHEYGSTNDTVDLKTITNASDDQCERAISQHGYHIQMATIAEAIEAVTGEVVPDDGFALLFVEKTAPYAVNFKPIPASDIYDGRCVVRASLRLFAECLETGRWPGYPGSGTSRGLPAWKKKQYEDARKAGILPTVGLERQAAE